VSGAAEPAAAAVPIRAIVFDLYGTLLHLRDLSFQRLAPRLVGAGRREWVAFLRGDLLVRSYADRGAMIAAIAARFAPDGGDDLRTALHDLLERELVAVEPEPALRSLLGFLRRRGFALAVLTNSASPYREPFERLLGSDRLDVVGFSCELGTRKPEPESYRRVLDALGVAPGEALMVGDSLRNDTEAPAALGLQTLLLGRSALHPAVERFADLAWIAGCERGEPVNLLPPFRRVTLGELAGTIVEVELLPDARQGRYNLVAAAEVAWDAGFRERLFLKRYRHPEAIEVERLARALLAEVGIDTNRVAVLDGPEPLLVARAVTGTPLGAGTPSPALAFEIGRHGASAYLFANADFRPRNAFLSEIAGRPRLTMVDYEYALFDRVLDLSDLPERFDPEALARRDERELLARGERRVLTRATMRRARREFFDARAVGREVLDAFRAGWREVHAAGKAAAPRIEALLRARLASGPPLVVGTEAHRRAFLPLDLSDLLERIATDPDAACDLGF
jgi:HAD superfamily hydrolase (TIGR01509 family)